MRRRDVCIVAVCVLATIVAWSQEGNVRFRHTLRIQLYDGGNHHYVPPPIVTDVRGLGAPNILAARQPDVLALYAAHRAGIVSPPVQVAEVQTQGNIVGFSAGYLSFPHNATPQTAAHGRFTVGKQRQHVAVVTDDFAVTLYDKDLRQLWSSLITAASTAPLHQATVSVLPDRVYEKDVGMVVVSLSIAKVDGVPQRLYAAFNGATGELRWRHATTESLNDDHTMPADSFKFSDRDLDEAARTTEWTKFRASAIAAMPHAFSHPWDGKLLPFTLAHSKNRKKRGRSSDLTSSAKRRVARGKKSDDFGDLGARISSQSSHATPRRLRPLPNVLVSHTPHGVDFVHLFTGRVVTSVGPLQPHTTYDDVNDDLRLDAVTARVGTQQSYHGRHGVDEVAFCDGVIETNVPFASEQLASVGICDTQGFLASLGYLRHFGGEGTSIRPDPLSLIGSHSVARDVQAVRPLVVHHRQLQSPGSYRHSRLAVFFVSAGVVTAVDTKLRKVVWRTNTASQFRLHGESDREAVAEATDLTSFIPSEEEKLSRLHVYPHLAPFCFHTRFADPADVRNVFVARQRHEPLLLAVGSDSLTLLNSITGAVEATAPMNATPVAPVIVGDFDGDGINDVLILTSRGIEGFVVRHHASGSGAALLMILVVVAIASLFISQYGFETNMGPTTISALRTSKRSTD